MGRRRWIRVFPATAKTAKSTVALAVVAGLAAIVTLTQCSAPGQEAAKRTATLSPSAAMTLPSTSTGAAEVSALSPAIMFTDLNEHSSSPFPSDVKIAEPHLTGVADAVSAKFDAAFERLVADQRSTMDHIVTTYANTGADCEDPIGNRRAEKVTLTGTTLAADVYDGKASVSTKFTLQDGCNRPNTAARSVTVDIVTGDTVPISAITDTASGAFQSEVTMRTQRECPDIELSTGESGRVEEFPAFTPAADGLVLTWTNQDFLPWSCGVVTIRLPWDELPAPRAESSAPAAPAALAACAGSPRLPDGIDPRVCGPVPSDAVKPTLLDLCASGDCESAGRSESDSSNSSYTLASPTGNILCDMSTTSVACAAQKYDFTPIPEGPEPTVGEIGAWRPSYVSLERSATAGAWTMQPLLAEIVAHGSDSTDSPKYLAAAGILPYGRVAAIGSVACVSQEIGMSCWDVATKHGFFLSRQSYQIW